MSMLGREIISTLLFIKHSRDTNGLGWVIGHDTRLKLIEINDMDNAAMGCPVTYDDQMNITHLVGVPLKRVTFDHAEFIALERLS